MIATLTLNPAVDVITAVAHVSTHGKLRCSAPVFAPGGGGVNVARTVTALGGAARAVLTHGGPTGERLVDLLESEAVPVQRVDIRGETRENVLVRETATGHELHIVLPGPPLQEDEWQACLDAIATMDPAPAYVAASGTLPPGVPLDFYARLADLVRARSGRLVLDSAGEPLRRALDRGVWLVKPNVRELAELTGINDHDEAALEQAARSLVAGGRCEAVVLSLGRGGAFLTSHDSPGLYVRSPVVRQESRVGAGDGMVGGLVLALDDGLPLDAAVLRGVAAGAATVIRADRGPCRREDAERLYALVAASSTAAA